MIFYVVVAMVVFAVFFVAPIVLPQFEIVSLRKKGRTIEWPKAIEKVGSGEGFLVENLTEISGEIWWIPDREEDNSVELYIAMVNSGKLVEKAPRDAIAIMRQSRRLCEKIARLDINIPLD